MQPLSIEQVAERGGVDVDYVDRLVELGALEPRDGRFTERDVHVVALLRTWDSAGLAPESILKAVSEGELSFAFLETPAWTLPPRLELTYRELAVREGVPLDLILELHEAIGFEAPDPDERGREDDHVMIGLARTLIGGGMSEAAIRRVFRLYADNLRRLAIAEAELYQRDVEQRLKGSRVEETDLMAHGSQLGQQMLPWVRRALFAIYDRYRQHVWADVSISRAEDALERAGLYRRASRPPAICFVDLSGYTRLTEEQGDEVAAQLAAGLSTLVEDISRRHGGRAIRWLGDGGMFRFDEPAAAVRAALETVESAPRAGLPQTHIGIEAGPVVAQDGDIYGRTVNVAARIASHAEGGEVLTSESTMRLARSDDLRFERLGEVTLKGLTAPLTLYRAFRRQGRTRVDAG